jgi:hypothetical protein
MVVEVTPLLETIAQELQLSESDLVRHGVRAFVERQLLQVNAQVLEITGRYRVSSVAEMDARYQQGALDESESWRDYQRLDHLEFERDRLRELFEALA